MYPNLHKFNALLVSYVTLPGAPSFLLKNLEKNPPDGLASELRGANSVSRVGLSGTFRIDICNEMSLKKSSVIWIDSGASNTQYKCD